MKRYTILLLFAALFLTACGQTESYSPAVITPSKIEMYSVPAQTDAPLDSPSSEILPVESVNSPVISSSAKSVQKSTAASSKTTASKAESVISAIPSTPSAPIPLSVPSTSSSTSIISSDFLISSAPVSLITSSGTSVAAASFQSVSTGTTNSTSPTKSSVPAITNSQDIKITSLTSPIVRGQDASITIKGKPDVEYTIKVIYKSGPSSAKGLEPKTSESDGKVTWSWKVSSRTTAGEWSIEISGDGASVTVPFVVTE